MSQPPGPLCALFRRHLRDVGLKYTPERARTLDAAFHIGRAFEVEELMHELSSRGGGASKATVYRTVRLMVDAGVLEQILIDRDRAHYRISTGDGSSTTLIDPESGKMLPVGRSPVEQCVSRHCDKERMVIPGLSHSHHGQLAGPPTFIKRR